MPCEMRIRSEAEENILEMDAMGCPYGTSIEDSDILMARMIDKLMQVRDISRIMIKERRIFEYNQDQTRMLAQIADVVKFIKNSADIFSYNAVSVPNCPYRDAIKTITQLCFPSSFPLISILLLLDSQEEGGLR